MRSGRRTDRRPAMDRLNEHDHERQAEDQRHPSLPSMDPVVAVDGQDKYGHREDRDPSRDADGPNQQIHRVRLDDQLSREETEVENDRRGKDEHRAVETELSTALDHLRHAELRALDRVEANEGEPDDDAEDNRDARPEHVEPHEDRNTAEHNRKDVCIQAEPESELITDSAVPLLRRDLIDRTDLDLAGALTAQTLLRRYSVGGHVSPVGGFRSKPLHLVDQCR